MSSIAPYHLPQINAPFNYTLDRLDDEGITYKYMQIDPEDLLPSQSIILSNKMDDININSFLKPIWISNDLKIIDGHHRAGVALGRNTPIKCVKIMLPQKDAIRILNKIQDIFEYENQEKVMEVVAQDQINAMNEPDSGVSTSEFLATLEDISDEDDREILHDNKKTKKLSAYRKTDINEKSVVGNFFSLKESDGYSKYDIEFDSLLDTNDLGLTYHSGSSPVAALCKKWFPKIDFDKIAGGYGVKPESIMNRAVAEKARKLGHDGIKYGDIMVQGL